MISYMILCYVIFSHDSGVATEAAKSVSLSSTLVHAEIQYKYCGWMQMPCMFVAFSQNMRMNPEHLGDPLTSQLMPQKGHDY